MIARWCNGLTAACVVLSAAFLVGCSSSSGSATNNAATKTAGGASASVSKSASAMGTSAACKSAANLKSSIAGLANVNFSEGGISAVAAQVTKIQQDLAALKADSKGQFTPQVNALSTALKNFSSSLDAAKAGLNAGTAQALAKAGASVVTTGQSLVKAVDATC